jgi:mannose-6-phosphate isomerase-like protein (cupin superfamily)
MKSFELHSAPGFHVLGGTERSQAATMVLAPGETEGGPDNEHKGSDQWLYVMAGNGKAVVKGQEIELHEGSLVLIEAGEQHEIKNTGSQPLKTVNFYSPPEYRK